jgi:hypothetical protein
MGYKIGDSINTFWGVEKILDIYPYDGRYTKLFDTTLKVAAPRTNRGWMEVPIRISK